MKFRLIFLRFQGNSENLDSNSLRTHEAQVSRLVNGKNYCNSVNLGFLS